MLTLKLIKTPDAKDNGQQETIISAQHAEITPFDVGFVVAIYPDAFKNKAAVEYRVANQPDAYDHCYIENAAGKTVQHVRWKQ